MLNLKSYNNEQDYRDPLSSFEFKSSNRYDDAGDQEIIDRINSLINTPEQSVLMKKTKKFTQNFPLTHRNQITNSFDSFKPIITKKREELKKDVVIKEVKLPIKKPKEIIEEVFDSSDDDDDEIVEITPPKKVKPNPKIATPQNEMEIEEKPVLQQRHAFKDQIPQVVDPNREIKERTKQLKEMQKHQGVSGGVSGMIVETKPTSNLTTIPIANQSAPIIRIPLAPVVMKTGPRGKVNIEKSTPLKTYTRTKCEKEIVY
jgi:hypothetical protein